MRIWIDLANSPHVPFFRALIPEFIKRGHEVEITARDFAETVPLAIAAGLNSQIIGRHGGKEIANKAGNLFGRARALWAWARNRKFDLAVSHNSYAQLVSATALRLKSVTLMDYEHQPANHLAFRLATRVIVPHAFPDSALKSYGAKRKVRRYGGTKEDVYLADFTPDTSFASQLDDLGINSCDVFVLVRPPANEALYHRFENQLFDELLEWLIVRPAVKVLLLPRNQSQRDFYSSRAARNLILPAAPMDGQNLIAASDQVVSAGGTMNREAAALGIPAATVYAGKWAAIDEVLVKQGRLQRITNRRDFDSLILTKKKCAVRKAHVGVRTEVVDLILD